MVRRDLFRREPFGRTVLVTSRGEVDEPACPKHPEWRPRHRNPGQPRPPYGLCPFCQEEDARPERRPEPASDGATDALGFRADEVLPHPLQVKDTGRLALAGEQFRERQREAGIPLPSSAEEADALDRIRDLREDEERILRSGSGYAVAFTRIERGELVEYRRVSDGRGRNGRRRTRLVRVTP